MTQASNHRPIDPARRHAERPLLRNKDFLLLWGGHAVSHTGTNISEFALPILVLAVTGSPAVAGVLAALERVPYLILGLPAGALIDRWNRKVVMVSCNAVRFVVLGSVALVALQGEIALLHLAIATACSGFALVFFDIADNAAFPKIVSARQLPKAASLMEGTTSAAELVGPALGGLVIGVGATVVIGAGLAYALDALTYAFAGLTIAMIGRALQDEREQYARNAVVREALNGLRFLYGHAELRRLALANFANIVLLAPVWLLVIVLARTALHASAPVTGLVFGLGGVGGILGSVATPLIRIRLDARQTMTVACGVWSAAAAILALASSIPGLILAWFLISAMMPIYFSTLYAHRVTLIPDRLQGRVNSIYRVLAQAGSPIGMAAGGFIIGSVGARWLAVVMSAGFACSVFLAWATAPRRPTSQEPPR